MKTEIVSYNPATGAELGRMPLATEHDYDQAADRAARTFGKWRLLPAPQRGEIVREIGDELRKAKVELGRLVTLEAGKIAAEGQGEVQEMIDIAGFAVGLSRQLYGLTMPSERPGHRMYEQWHPLGPVGIITAFNFPVAVWAWNALIALVCGDTVIWKPSLKTPLTAIAVQHICDRRLPLISATGSCRMGHIVGPEVAARMGRSLLELGGNNAVIVMDDADLD